MGLKFRSAEVSGSYVVKIELAKPSATELKVERMRAQPKGCIASKTEEMGTNDLLAATQTCAKLKLSAGDYSSSLTMTVFRLKNDSVVLLF
jgi:hypothetical protein